MGHRHHKTDAFIIIGLSVICAALNSRLNMAKKRVFFDPEKNNCAICGTNWLKPVSVENSIE